MFVVRYDNGRKRAEHLFSGREGELARMVAERLAYHHSRAVLIHYGPGATVAKVFQR